MTLDKPTLKTALPFWLRFNINRIWGTLIGIGVAFSIGNVSGHTFDLLRVICPVRWWAILFFVAAVGILISKVLQRIDLMRWSITVASTGLAFIAGADFFTFFSVNRAGLFAAVSYTALAVSGFQTVYELAKRD
jgi:hypothetical protein